MQTHVAKCLPLVFFRACPPRSERPPLLRFWVHNIRKAHVQLGSPLLWLSWGVIDSKVRWQRMSQQMWCHLLLAQPWAPGASSPHPCFREIPGAPVPHQKWPTPWPGPSVGPLGKVSSSAEWLHLLLMAPICCREKLPWLLCRWCYI